MNEVKQAIINEVKKYFGITLWQREQVITSLAGMISTEGKSDTL